jgi:hypothetical protein
MINRRDVFPGGVIVVETKEKVDYTIKEPMEDDEERLEVLPSNCSIV